MVLFKVASQRGSGNEVALLEHLPKISPNFSLVAL